MKPISFTLASLALILSACGQPEKTGALTGAEEKMAAAAQGDKLPGGSAWMEAAASPLALVPAWSNVQNTGSWTDTVHQIVKAQLKELEKARDKSVFCPGYDAADQLQREACWVRLVSAIVFFESGFKPGDVFTEPNGAKSVGLMSLSPGECVNAPTVDTLKVPEKNLACGTAKMASLIARHGYIDGPVSQRGAAAYWSVLRKPYVAHGYKLGKKDKIIALSKEYKAKLTQ